MVKASEGFDHSLVIAVALMRISRFYFLAHADVNF
jgi:hypothetical protein